MIKLQYDRIILAAVYTTMRQQVSEDLLLLHALPCGLLSENPLLLIIGQSLPTLFALFAAAVFAVGVQAILVASILAKALDRSRPAFEAGLR